MRVLQIFINWYEVIITCKKYWTEKKILLQILSNTNIGILIKIKIFFKKKLIKLIKIKLTSVFIRNNLE